MIWFGNLLLALGLTVGNEPPEALAARVRAAVAEQWGVESELLKLEWGHLAAREPVEPDAAFRLLGTGRDGRFVVTIRTGPRSEAAVTLRVGVFDSVWVAARPIVSGTRLAAPDLTRAARLVWGRPDQRAEAPIGWEARRNLAAGEIAAPGVIAPPALVEPGDRVRFVWERAGFRVEREGVAVNRARLGERVIARDQARQDQLSGVVTGPRAARLEGKGIR
ncbi:MAG: flagellar basal body P-ring formation chaperone FlgA [Gemmatimonadales bacterium]|nr:flagellar basal body P-ring formation chaperone FlgA [Gemmatimonadales bacterium]